MSDAGEKAGEEYWLAIIGGVRASLEAGFAQPLHIAVVGANGAVRVMRFSDTPREADLLAEHHESEGMAFPINIMITDARGRASLWFVEPSRPAQLELMH